MPQTVDLTIEPNDKYYRVTEGYADPDDVESNEAEWNDWPDEHKEAADAYLEHIAATPEYDSLSETVAAKREGEFVEMETDEHEPLSWDHFGVASDPDLIAKMATYFDGLTPDEPTDLLRAKLRLLPPEVYANAQIASKAELRN